VDQAAGEVVLLEAVEAAAYATPESASAWGKFQTCAHGIAEPQRLLADEPDGDCAIRAEQPLAGGTRGSGYASHLDRSSLRAKGPSLIGTALYNAQVALAALPNAKPSRMDGGTESKPYAGWCGTGELITPRDPIRVLL